MEKFYHSFIFWANWFKTKSAFLFFLIFFIFLFALPGFAQSTTSWRGTSSTGWFTSANWTNGVPTATTDVIIGDANFTGANQPEFGSSTTVKSLTIGGGTKAATLSLLNYKTTLRVTGNVTLAANGTLSNTAGALFIGGNWSNAGTYQTASGRGGSKTYNAAVFFNGTTQTISGTTAFMDLTVNQGSTTTLSNNITVTANFSVTGTFDPVTYLVTLSGSTFTIGSTGNLKVKAGTFNGNYSIIPTSVQTGSIVDYAATDRTQSIAAFSATRPFSTLIVSGGTVKTLTSNIAFAAANSADGILQINSGTLDLGTFTANRATTNAGGTLNILNGATLKVGGSNPFPANFVTRILGVTSTVEYNGTNQAVSPETYGNLTLSASSGAAVKTMPGVPFTTVGNLTSSVGAGTSVSFTAGQNITINGNLMLGANTTFNGAAFTHTLDGNWVNAGTFTGNTSTVILRGTGKVIDGTATTSFNNLTFTGNIRGKTPNIAVGGNLATTGAGTFIHAADINGVATNGTFTLNGTGKIIQGTDITFDNLVVSGTISSVNDLTITGNLNVSTLTTNAFNLTGGTVHFSGTGKTISAGSATGINFNALRVTGTVATNSSFSVKSDFSGNGRLTATAGTVFFTGTSTYVGQHKLFNVTLNGTILQLAANSILGIANTFTLTTGTFDVAASAPNTVEYNGAAQNITGTTYHTLILTGTGIKSALNNFTTNGDVQINAGTTLNAGNYTHTVKGNWINNGTFSAGNSIILFTGSEEALITGATTFATLSVNKSSLASTVTLNSHVTTAAANIITGELRTGAYVITITSTRTGAGIILGTITRNHVFNANTAYAFGGPFNTLTFGTAANITSVTVTITLGNVSNFPYGGSVSCLYTISIPNGTYTNATLRLSYKDIELNGNSEANMRLWKYGTTWTAVGKTSNSSIDNWVENAGLANITGQWTLSDDNIVMQWTGVTDNNWALASNWTAIQGTNISRVPLSTDIVEIGGANYVNQPVISANVSVKSIQFGSTRNAVLTLSGGNLTVNGNLHGAWSGNATHTVAVGNQTLNIGGDLILSDGTRGHEINLSIGSGNVVVAHSLFQSGNAAISFSGAGNLAVDTDFIFTDGTFSPHTGTVTYNGSGNQVVAGNINYYNLVINKSAGIASNWAPATILGNLSLLTGSTLVTQGNLTIAGNCTIGTGTTFNGSANTHTITGNWVNNGLFVPASGTVIFGGTANQNIMASTFNNLIINKTGGKATLTGNLILNGNVRLEAGALDLADKTLTRSAVGENLNLLANTVLYVGGSNNYPAGFNAHNLDNTSTVVYNGPGIQSVARVNYGHLIFQNGAANAKNLTGSTTVKGNLSINNGATLHAGAYTLTCQGNIQNNGIFNPGTGTVILAGTAKTTEGNLIFNDLTLTGSYTVTIGSFTVNNNFYNSGSLTAGTNTGTFSGNFTNAGTIASDGTTIFTGTQPQTLQLIGTITSTAAGIVYFNGSVAPILNSTSLPSFVSVIINNTAGIAPSVGWTVYGLFKVSAGAAFHGGISTHNFLGPVVNDGTITSGGTLNFVPTETRTLTLGTSFSSSGTVVFGGTGQITIASSPATLANLEIANTHTAGITPPANWNITRNLVIKLGSQLNGGAGLNHQLAGNFINDGTLNGNTSTFTFEPAASVIDGTGTTNFNHVVINDSTTVLANINIKGNFTNNGILVLENNTVNFNGTANQVINGTAEISFYDLNISNTTSKVLTTTNLNVANSLNLNPGTTFKPAETVILNNGGAEGSLTGSGTIEVTRILAPADYLDQYKFNGYDLNTLTVKFSGTAAQSSSLTAFHNLTIENPAGFTLSGPTTVSGTLRLENSNISNNGHLLTVGTSAAAPGLVEVVGTGMVAGKLKRWISASTGADMLFPVGTGITRRMATIRYTSAPSGGTLTAEFVSTNPGTAGLPLTEPNGQQEDFVVNKVGTSGYWTITAGTTGAENLTNGIYNATLEASNFAGLGNLQNFVLLKRGNNTQPWDLPGTHVTATGSVASPIISRTNLSGFSDFALGGSDPILLPVTMHSFKAVAQFSDAILTWKTAMEINNQGFYVEVSEDGKLYRNLGFVPGKEANTTKEQTYRFTDSEKGKWGTRYYRLKQLDVDGKINYYGPKALNFEAEPDLFTAYPNPFSKTVEITVASPVSQAGQVILKDMQGQEIWNTTKEFVKGRNKLTLDMPQELAKGLYFLHISLNQTGKTIKLIKD